ncbi:hypothetical protein [Agromyces sp. Soil535]|uniref:hypothetical protein n=1 Tax=Agromyces sp. Soil535 TaxID=1736390 RepID=UPI0006FB3A11|nr:hypothetical protein [Agromyces sp. Soil535]KRE25925.1 hypothetical protein ASG80_03580 [Agromyces sp. Soil535]
MTDRISRRTLLSSAAFIVPTFLAPKVPSDPAYPRFGGSASTTGAARAVVATVRSYGPNGTHWPANTPQLGSTFGRVIDVACDWTSIGKAIAAVTDAEIEKGVHVRIAPGTLPGYGASSGSAAALKGVGRGSASKNILVSPKQGWGSVTVTESARLMGVKGVTFARINGRFILLTDCSRTSWAHSKVSYGFRMTASSGVVKECNAYEVVMADAKIDINDPFGFAAGRDSMITKSVWEGCYCAPVFRPSGASDHIDTLQMYGNGAYRGLTVRDSTFFGALNSALQLGGPKSQDPDLGTPFMTLDHSILTAQVIAMRVRYPAPQGANTPTMGQAINGSGEPGQLFAKDSYVFGSMYDTEWGSVQNSFTSYYKAPANNPAASGGWQYDASMSSWGADRFDQLTPTPTDDYLRRVWA